MTAFWDRVKKTDGCWIWQGPDNGQGYGTLRLPGVRKKSYAHRVSYEMLVGPIPEGLYLDHLCRNPPCVNPDHLEPVTHAENVRRGLAVGHTNTRGELSGMAKITDREVDQIRALYATGGWTHRGLAARFGMGKSQVGYIVNRRSRHHHLTPIPDSAKPEAP